MVRQPPQLLTRVIRAIVALREPKGSSVSSIITQVRLALNDASSEIPRNITMQVRRALKHAMDNGLLQQRAGRYRVAGKKRLLPVDSMELAADRGKRRRTGRKRKRSGRRRSSEHDRSKTKQRSRKRKGQSRTRGSESPQSTNASKPSTAKTTERQASPAENSAINLAGDPEHSGTPFPDSKEASPARDGRRGRRRRRPRKSRSRNHNDGPPNVGDEPMDDEIDPRERSLRRTMTPRRSSLPQQREQEENDSLEEIHDRPPSYYN